MTSPARSLSLLAAALAVALTVSGCASSFRQPRATSDRINSELDQARASLSNGSERSASAGAASSALLPPLDLSLPKAAEVEPRFDLSVSNAPAQSVFVALVSGTRYSMLVSPEVSGSLTVNLKDVTVREALEAIREVYGYDFRIQGSRIYVHPNTMQTRIFKVNYLVGRRVTTSNLRVNSTTITTTPTSGTGGTPGTGYPGATGVPGSTGVPGQPGAPGSTQQVQTDAARVLTTSDNDFWKELKSALEAIVGDDNGRSVVTNGVSGVVLVRGMPQDIRNVEQYLRATQLIIERQVMLEAKIIDVTLSDQFSAGINWSIFSGTGSRLSSIGAVNPGNSLSPAGKALSAVGLDNLATGMTNGVINPTSSGNGFFGLAFQTKSFAALLSFLESQGDVQVLSSPRIAAVNNQKAVLKVGTDDFYVTNVSSTVTTSGTGNIVTPTITLQAFFSGVALDVMPQIDEDNNILLHVHPSVSNVTEKEKVVDLGTQLGTFKLPLASSAINETDSIVRVQDGNIVAIGGLMSQAQAQTQTGLPGTTGSIWGTLLGGNRNNSMNKRELVILIKPTIIQDPNDWAKDLDDTRERLRNNGSRRPVEGRNGG
ncbi:pilus (MSHA type) biogenesis protein MshL [Oryzomicrobium sp.]|uniref:pilus (MSHA type) biogenesis protein MshL n=1 Tax=Oryzomicrobium sp. TaxID=1911578 RepID=UPI0025EEA701|nr:pilus (MSHA type) biogenesis protein MshL [Oryzomicrobium sp.]MCE1244682.1 secretin N-terminal domain-containing protein [Oryzomicrobium sp.]